MALATTVFERSNLYSICDLRQLGYIKTCEAVKAASTLLLVSFWPDPGPRGLACGIGERIRLLG